MPEADYSIYIEPADQSDGGGYMARVAELPGCMSDGETREEATLNAREAIAEWITRAKALGRVVPQPTRLYA